MKRWKAKQQTKWTWKDIRRILLIVIGIVVIFLIYFFILPKVQYWLFGK
jgi:preprotein translocase subunit SecE